MCNRDTDEKYSSYHSHYKYPSNECQKKFRDTELYDGEIHVYEAVTHDFLSNTINPSYTALKFITLER